VIFDLDGLLLDTEPLYEEAISGVLHSFGKTYDLHLRSNVLGKGEQEGAGIIVSSKLLPITPDQFLAQRNAILKELFPNALPKPGAVELTKHLKNHKIPIALATSSHKRFLSLKFTGHPGWLEIFDFVITGDQVSRSKPDPEIFTKAAQGLNLKASECLVFEDSPAGAESGRRAGCTVVAVPDPSVDRARYDGWAHNKSRTSALTSSTSALTSSTSALTSGNLKVLLVEVLYTTC